MEYTLVPSVKGQITIPSSIREKYGIGKMTPIVIEDEGKGVLKLKIMQMVDNDDIQLYENIKEIGIHFKKGIDPQVLKDSIKKIDGQD